MKKFQAMVLENSPMLFASTGANITAKQKHGEGNSQT